MQKEQRMTWNEFKTFIESNGVKGDEKISYIDLSGTNIPEIEFFKEFITITGRFETVDEEEEREQNDQARGN